MLWYLLDIFYHAVFVFNLCLVPRVIHRSGRIMPRWYDCFCLSPGPYCKGLYHILFIVLRLELPSVRFDYSGRQCQDYSPVWSCHVPSCSLLAEPLLVRTNQRPSYKSPTSQLPDRHRHQFDVKSCDRSWPKISPYFQCKCLQMWWFSE